MHVLHPSFSCAATTEAVGGLLNRKHVTLAALSALQTKDTACSCTYARDVPPHILPHPGHVHC